MISILAVVLASACISCASERKLDSVSKKPATKNTSQGKDIQQQETNETVSQNDYSNIQISTHSGYPSEIVYGFTGDKKLWETPKEWYLKEENFPGETKAYFWVANDNKVLVMREDKKEAFYICLDKSTGKMLWEIPKQDYRIDGYEDGILKLHSIKNNRQITIADGLIKDDQPKTFDKLILFETDLPKTHGSHRYGDVFDWTDGYYLYYAFDFLRLGGRDGNLYCIDINGKITPFDNESSPHTPNEKIIRRYKSKFYFPTKSSNSDQYAITQVDMDTGESIQIKKTDVPKNAALLQEVQDNKLTSNDLDKDTINRIGITVNKPNDKHYFIINIEGMTYNKYLVCQRVIDTNTVDVSTQYSDYTGIYDAKTLRKLWSYENKVENIYFHDSTVIINGDWENQVVLFKDLETGKTLLNYDNAALLSKVGDVCFVACNNKLIAVNLKKLPK